MHHFHMGLLNSLNSPLAAANDPNVMLPASNLPPYTFKPSRVKNEWLLAFEPTNCHTQQIVVVAPEGEHRCTRTHACTRTPTHARPRTHAHAAQVRACTPTRPSARLGMSR